MKKVISTGFLLVVFCFTVSVYADGEMGTGNKNCTSNCLVEMPTETSVDKTKTAESGSLANEVFDWLNKQLFELFN